LGDLYLDKLNQHHVTPKLGPSLAAFRIFRDPREKGCMICRPLNSIFIAADFSGLAQPEPEE